jgi:hypothetical protein
MYYAAEVMSKECPGVRLTYSKDRSDIASAANGKYAEYNLPIRLSAGKVRFSCIKSGKPAKGYIFVGTYETNDIWGVLYLFGTFATSSKINEAMSILSNEIKTFKENPQWVAMNA